MCELEIAANYSRHSDLLPLVELFASFTPLYASRSQAKATNPSCM